MPSIVGTCDVCSESSAKYRCPICVILYCSLNCFKGHKESCKPIEQPDVGNNVQRNGSSNGLAHKDKEDGEVSNEGSDDEKMEDEDRVPLERLQRLGDSGELKDLLHNPHLRQILSHLDKTDNKEKAIANAMQEPLFIEFADECLKVVEENDEKTMDST